jgi:hypothetical protein
VFRCIGSRLSGICEEAFGYIHHCVGRHAYSETGLLDLRFNPEPCSARWWAEWSDDAKPCAVSGWWASPNPTEFSEQRILEDRITNSSGNPFSAHGTALLVLPEVCTVENGRGPKPCRGRSIQQNMPLMGLAGQGRVQTQPRSHLTRSTYQNSILDPENLLIGQVLVFSVFRVLTLCTTFSADPWPLSGTC